MGDDTTLPIVDEYSVVISLGFIRPMDIDIQAEAAPTAVRLIRIDAASVSCMTN